MYQRIDTEEINRRADLLTLAGGNLRRVASSGGGEYAGACPIPGCRCDKDGFRVQPHHQPLPRWMCHNHTSGKWKNAIDLGYLLWPGLKFPEICERIAGGQLPTTSSPRPEPQPKPAAAAPGQEWQDAARAVIYECAETLWQPKYSRVLDYLRGRGLRDETIKHFGLGYCATGKPDQFGREICGLYVPRGILIPGTLGRTAWYLKIRLMPGVPCWCQTKDCKTVLPGPGDCPNCGKSNKYRGVKGNQTAAIFNADSFRTQDLNGGPVLFVEGEFDCMLAWQEIGDLLPVATLGASTNRPDLATWGRYFLNQSVTLICYDLDGAGQQGAEALAEMAHNPAFATLPAGNWKDITDYHLAGGSLREWIGELLEWHCPESLPGEMTRVEVAQALGGVIVSSVSVP